MAPHLVLLFLLIDTCYCLEHGFLDEVMDDADLSQPACIKADNRSNGTGWGSCPMWSTCQNSSCMCSKIVWSEHVLCARSHTEITPCTCLTYDHNTSQFSLGTSMYCCAKKGQAPLNYVRLPNNISNVTVTMCQELNRNGTLCGSCANGLWPLVYSYNLSCVKCSHNNHNWFRYFAMTLASTTIFYMIILIFRVSITSPYVYCYVFYAQAISTPNMVRIAMLYMAKKPTQLYIVKCLSSLYAIWSLDFFRADFNNICMRSSTLGLYAIEISLVLYPVLLVIISYVLMKCHNNNCRVLVFLWRPFKWLISLLDGENENTRSLVDAYTIFMHLSVVKVLYISVDILIPSLVSVLDSNGKITNHHVCFWNGSVKYFSSTHYPYAVLAIAFLIVYVVLPTTVLLFYPFHAFQTLLNLLPLWLKITVHHYVEKFQGYYKDGTGGTSDCRYFSVFYIVLTVVMFIIYIYSLKSFYLLGSCALMVFASLVVFMDPFKERTATTITYSSLVVLSLQYFTIYISVTSAFNEHLKMFFEVAALCMAFIPLLYICIVVLYIFITETVVGKTIAGALKQAGFK